MAKDEHVKYEVQWNMLAYLLLVILLAGWAHSGLMCYKGEDFPAAVDTVFRPCGLFVAPFIALLIVFMMISLPSRCIGD